MLALDRSIYILRGRADRTWGCIEVGGKREVSKFTTGFITQKNGGDRIAIY